MAETTLSSVTKMRLKDEMLGSIKEEDQWGILLLDSVTTQILSSVTTVSDLLEYGVSLVDNVLLPREPMPHMTGIYFITPNENSIRALVADFQNKKGQQQYGLVHVFFSSAVSAELLEPIRKCTRLVQCLRTLKEVNLEYVLYPDNRGFTTCQDNALQTFFSAYVDATDDYKIEVEKMADRLATMFSTMKEFPSIRYRAALPPGDDYPPGLESRLLIAQRLAVELFDRLLAMQKTGQIPDLETCELIITDRGFDPVAPIIHEWTYEAMTHDLLETAPVLNGKVFIYDSQTEGAGKERKEHALDDRDAIFRDIRHRHFAAASIKITSQLDELRLKSAVATSRQTGAVGDMDLRKMGKLVQALPQYRTQLTNLAVHVELASMLNRIVEQYNLTEVGRLEQDLVYGDANSKDIISFFAQHQILPINDKLRMLMCYCATHQEKLDNVRQAQWQKLARLGPTEMATIINMEYLGVPVCKRVRSSLAATMTFRAKRKRALRKDRDSNESDQQYALTRFVPMVNELIEDAVANKLSQDEYPYVRPPPTSPMAAAAYTGNASPLGATSFRTVRSGTWIKKSPGAAANGGGANTGKGNRVFAFIVGGFTFSELRVAHKLSDKLGRDVMIGGTNIITPRKFMENLYNLGVAPESPRPSSARSSVDVAPAAQGKKKKMGFF